ncbi:ester cyclase [Nocardia pseudobrasiliensis]|uniref:Putative ester cyclase n=1 Tax=Nocardia pseudobrasiliensis TaxID=45979 RepID=A0A370I941_9NOCA|nr:ester cyclase [Nocardia pseudobrasiliensis]RDI67229.1 putative ester cyclase [Nocardia pseudobrasiliensis]
MESTTATDRAEELLTGWIALWNGDYSAATSLIAPDFTVHAAMFDGSAVRGPQGLVDWIARIRAAFSELVFHVEVGPIVDGCLSALRWIATGTYGGGFPGATAPQGTSISFTGTDTLRIEDGELAEYWLNSDVHVLLAQLGVQF